MAEDWDDIHDRVHDTIVEWTQDAIGSKRGRSKTAKSLCQDVTVAIGCASLAMWQSLTGKSEPDDESDEQLLSIVTLSMTTGAAMEAQWEDGVLGFGDEDYKDRD